MSEPVTTAVITGFSALGTVLALLTFISRALKDLRADLKAEISEVKTDLRADISRLDERFDVFFLEFLRHIREGHPPPTAA